jgi:hypothetical protein
VPELIPEWAIVGPLRPAPRPATFPRMLGGALGPVLGILVLVLNHKRCEERI